MPDEMSPEDSADPGPDPNTPPGEGTSHAPEGDGAPQGLLEQMEELMAALNADLTRLDADLQSTVNRPSAPRPSAPGDEIPDTVDPNTMDPDTGKP